MKKKWLTKALDELCYIARGGSPRPIKAFITEESDGVNWIKISDATASSKYIYTTKQKIKPEGIKKSRLVKDGDFLLSNSMSFGRPYIMRTTGCIHDGWLVLSDKSGLFDQDYLYYFLGSPNAYQQFDSRAAGSTVRNLNIDLVRTVNVPIPTLPEQKRIVAILDEAFAGIATATANAEKNLKNARELFESTLNSVFTEKGEGWMEKKLGDVCVIKPPKSEAKKILKPTDSVSFVPMEYLMIGQKYFDVEQERALEKVSGSYTYFADGDVLLAKITPCFENGKLGIARHLKNGIGFGSSEYIVFRPLSDLISDFLYYYLSREQFRKEGKPKMTGAVGHKRLPKDFIENYKIYLPSLNKQRDIVAKFESLSIETTRLEAIYQQKLDALAELKQSILQKAFVGELTSDTAKIAIEEVA